MVSSQYPRFTMRIKAEKQKHISLTPNVSLLSVYIKLEPIGCFEDRPSRALRVMYADLRSQIRWSIYPDTSYIVKACAEKAYQEAYSDVFGVQFYGECWSDGSANTRYNKYGVSTNCEHGVGKDWANMVYRYEGIRSSDRI